MEYSATLEMIKERRFIVDELWDRLRIVYGRVDVVRQNIDQSLSTDNQLHRQCGMMEFRSPYRFLDLTEMETQHHLCGSSGSAGRQMNCGMN